MWIFSIPSWEKIFSIRKTQKVQGDIIKAMKLLIRQKVEIVRQPKASFGQSIYFLVLFFCVDTNTHVYPMELNGSPPG